VPSARHPLCRSVGRRVAELRVAAALTQDALGVRLGVSLRYVQRMEAGEENLSLVSLHHLAKILRVPVSALFEAPHTSKPRVGRPRGPIPPGPGKRR
jgi:transcriptional regulator with XRE-family HTH domain